MIRLPFLVPFAIERTWAPATPRRLPRRRRAHRALPARAPLCAALALTYAATAYAQGQPRADATTLARVNDAAFDHWWPKYERLMQTLIANQNVEPGRLKVPPPRPEDLRREIEVGQGFSNPNLPGYRFFGVQTSGSVFEGLFLMDPSGNVRVLVNHDDPEDRKPIIEDAYVDQMNGILERAGVTVDEPSAAASLARFFLSTFFNFTLHPDEGLIDPAVQDELQRVRVVNSSREIPQGRRVLRFGNREAALAFEPVPATVREAIKPPVVSRPDPRSFLIELYTWHPVRGEVKRWQILIRDSRFAFFRDQTVAQWKPYRFEGMH